MPIKLLRHFFNFYIILFVLFISFISIFIWGHNKSAFANDDLMIEQYMMSLNYLPTYCQYRLAEAKFRGDYTVSDGKRYWPEKFGKSLTQWRQKIGRRNWAHIHHYCYGIKAFTEYSNMNYKAEERQKKQKLERALREFQYITKAKTENFPFWYEKYRYEGYIYLYLGDTAKAQRALQQSLMYKKQ